MNTTNKALPSTLRLDHRFTASVRDQRDFALRWCAVLMAMLLVPAAPAVAQHYPVKPIRIIVGFTPGNAMDIRARQFAHRIDHFGSERSPLFPNVPTLKESGFPALELSVWGGIFAPAGTPPEIVRRLNAELQKAGSNPELQQQMAATGSQFIQMSVEGFNVFVKTEFDKWQRMVKETGLKFE